MTDPRRPIINPTGVDALALEKLAYSFLLKATEDAAKALNITGASFVLLGLRLWAEELVEQDARAGVQYLRALADILDPAYRDSQKDHAERKRAAAVKRLFAALDLQMAKIEGRG